MNIQKFFLIVASSFSIGVFSEPRAFSVERPPVLSQVERMKSVRNSNDLLGMVSRLAMSYRFVTVGERPQFDLSSLQSLDWEVISSIVNSTTDYRLSVDGSVVNLFPKAESMPTVFTQKLASLSFKDVPISEALRKIGAAFQIEMTPHLKPAVANKVRVNVELKDATLTDALNSIAEQYANGSWTLNIPGKGGPHTMGFILSMPLNLPTKPQD